MEVMFGLDVVESLLAISIRMKKNYLQLSLLSRYIQGILRINTCLPSILLKIKPNLFKEDI